MRTFKQLLVIFIVVVIGVLVDCGFLYFQASTGRKLPFRLSLFPRIDGDLK